MSTPTKSYFLLAEPAPGHRIFDLLGRAVYIDGDSLKRPTEYIIKPRLPAVGPDLKELEPSLYPKHVEAKSAEVLREKAHDERAKASISKALNLFYRHEKSNQIKLSIPGFRRVTMEEHSVKIESLLNNAKYTGPILEFFQRFPKARFGIVVSIISCFEMEVGNKKSEEREGGGNAAVSGEAVGAPGEVGNVTLKAKAGGNTEDKLSGAYKDEVIIACSYVEMRLKKPPSNWKIWKSHKPSPYDITFTSETIHPLTMTVSVPPTRIKGDLEGGMTEGDGEAAASAGTSGQGDDGSDFVLYA
ncbi:hypothetical protein V8E54_014567 [Elaphomyces granulatus]